MLCLEYNLTSCRHHETHRIILFLICTPGEEGFLSGDEGTLLVVMLLESILDGVRILVWTFCTDMTRNKMAVQK